MIRSIDDYKMVITNSAVIINNYILGTCQTLERSFKVWDPVYFRYNILGMYYDSDNNKLYLPRGGDIDYYKRKIYTSEEYMDITSTIVRSHKFGYTADIKMKKSPRDNRQLEALNFMLCKDKYFRNNGKSQFQVNLNTGAGKTYCATAVISYTGIRTIIITAQSGILDQWRTRIGEYTNLPESEIVKIEGSQVINRILMDKSSITNKSVYLVTHSTLHYYGTENGWDKIGLLFNKLGIGIKIYDEAHQNFGNMCMVDFFTNVWRTYYLTATPIRSDRDEDRIYQIYMRNIPSIDLFDEEEDPHTKYISMKFNSNPKASDIAACKSSMYGLNHSAYIGYLMKNDRFWMMFDYIFSLVHKSGGKALFYIGTNDAILKVYNRIMMNYPELWNDVGIYTSINPNKALAKEKKYILTTTKSAGAGEDIPHLKYSIVLAEPFKSEVLARQSLGRTRDSDTLYIELVDVGFNQLKNYYKAKKSVFMKYASECKNIDVNDYKIINLSEEARLNMLNRFKESVYNANKGLPSAINIVDPENKPKILPAIRFISPNMNLHIGD